MELEALDHVGLYLPDPDGHQVEISTYEPALA